MDNHEEILDALTAFGKNPNIQEIPSILEQYLNCVAKNGETLFPWSQLKPLLLRKMELVISDLRQSLASENIPTRPNVENVRFDVIHARIIDSLHKFNGAPFTIQRLCELLIDPKRHYKRSDKFMRGLEKNVLVVSTVDPFGRKVVCESGNKLMVNGIPDVNGASFPSRDTGLSIPLPPVPGWVTTSTKPSTTASRSGIAGTTQDSKTTADTNVDNTHGDSEAVPNGVFEGMAVSSSVFTEQGDPLAVQSEEVVEETVVTMDTSEVSSVVTDGGEAMAEVDGVEGDMTEDREASSLSSSSSSSEELSTSSDSIETNLKASPFRVSVHNFNEDTVLDENRPWAAFAQDSKGHEDVSSHPSSDNTLDNRQEETQFSEASSSFPSSKSPEASASVSSSSSPAASDTQSSVLTDSCSSQQMEEKKVDSQTDQTPSDKSALAKDDVPASTNQNLGLFEPVKSASDHILPAVDVACPVSEEDKQAPSTTMAVTTSASESSDSHEPSSSSYDIVRTYAQVVASSSDQSIHLEPYNSSDSVPCDSVAGLERLVGSMEQSLSSPVCTSSSIAGISDSSSSHPSQQNINSSSVPTSAMTTNQQTVPSSSDYSSTDGEPASKRPRLSSQEDRMEEDVISTSGDSSIEAMEHSEEPVQLQESTLSRSSLSGEFEPQLSDESELVGTEVTSVAESVDESENEIMESSEAGTAADKLKDLKDCVESEEEQKSSEGMVLSQDNGIQESSTSDCEPSVSVSTDSENKQSL